MNKKHLLLLGTAITVLSSCNQPQNLNGVLTDYETDSIFLYQVKNEHYGSGEYRQSIPVTDGKFSIALDSIPTGLYCLSLQNTESGEYLEDYANLFLEPARMEVSISKNKYDKMFLQAVGSPLEDKYTAFQKAKDEAGNRVLLDSLDFLFYKAREKEDRTEMERIREVSGPHYESGREQVNALLKTEIEKNKGTYFGLYLYYTYRFQNNTFGSKEEIAEVRKYINEFDQMSKQSNFFTKIEETLNRFEKCAIGSPAPEISGIDQEGKAVTLNDFKGQYVLVDFWSSGCHWCRLETPNLLKTYNTFKDKNFTILGVSSDYKEEDWKKAIEEDKSYWNQILLPKKSIREVMDRYCIVGIPHIILIDPNGVIIAKELREENIYITVEKFVNSK